MADVSRATLTMRNGRSMPQIGLGVWQAGAETKHAVLTALRLGYRHIDTARAYANEAEVGVAVRESGLPREAVFVTTKLWKDDHGYDSARRAFDASLSRLGLDYVDLYLIHWPGPDRDKRHDAWRALEAIAAEGRAKSIGVSNFHEPHLEDLLAHAKEVPAANQIEVHPFLQQRKTRALCAKHGIVVQAYSPLTRGRQLDHPVLLDVAKRVGKTPAQVMLRWGIEHGLVILPKSVREERIRENADLFDFRLDVDAMKELDGLEAPSA